MRKRILPQALKGTTGISEGSVARFLKWFDVRHRGVGFWAFSLNRITGMVLVGYLFVHFTALTNLARGPDAYNAFVDRMKRPPFIYLDVALVGVLVFHGLNGLRISLTGLGVATSWQKELLWAVLVVGTVLTAGAAYLLLF